MSKKRIVGTAMAAVATTLAVFGAGGTAQAGGTSVVYATDRNGGVHGSMWHYDEGDNFAIIDLMKDGHGVRGTLMNANRGVLRSYYNGKGYNGIVSFSYDILEGRDYIIHICNVDGIDDDTGANCAEKVIDE